MPEASKRITMTITQYGYNSWLVYVPGGECLAEFSTLAEAQAFVRRGGK